MSGLCMDRLSVFVRSSPWRSRLAVAVGFTLLMAMNSRLWQSVDAQPSPNVRKVYVPDDSPADWPKGDWRPLATQKYLQWLRRETQTEETNTVSRFQQVEYACEYRDGQLVDGRLKASQPYLPSGRNWVSLGRTNLCLTNLTDEAEKQAWGTARDERLYMHRSLLADGLTADWSLPGTSATDGERFTLQLLPAQQSRLTIRLPDHLSLQVIEPANAPYFQRSTDDGFQECTIEGVEKSTLTFAVTAVTESESQQTSIARAFHQLQMSPAEMTFVSDLKFESVARPGRRVEIVLPDGLEVETVQWQQELLTSWNLEEPDGNEQTRLQVLLPESAVSGTLRFRGAITSAKPTQLLTTFPKLLNALTLSMQVNLLVRSPYLVDELQATDLEQIDVRLVNGVRDVWSYRATGNQPELRVRVAQPDPQVSIDQLLLVEADKQSLVHQVMLWKAQQEGVFHARFRIAPGYDVRDVALPGQVSDAGISWNVLRQERGNILLVHLANQLIPGQPLPVHVTLGNTFSNERSNRLTLPPLQLVSGKVERTYLVDQGVTVLRTVPERAELAAMSGAEAERWAVLTEPRLAGSPLEWKPSWHVLNITDLERVIVRPLPSELAEDVTATPREQTVKLNTSLLLDGEDVLIRHRLQIPPAVRRNDELVRLQVPADQATWNWYQATDEGSGRQAESQMDSRASDQLVHTADGNYEYRFYNGSGAGDSSEALIWETFYRPENASAFTLTLPRLDTEWQSICEVEWQTGAFFVHSIGEQPVEMQLDGDLSRLIYPADRAGQLTVRRAGDATSDSAEKNPWQMQVAAFLAPDGSFPSRVAVALTPPIDQSVLALPPLKFTSPVTVAQVQINGRTIALHQTGREIVLPAIEEPLHDLAFSYSTPVSDRVVLPQLPLPIQNTGLILATSSAGRPMTEARVSFWNEIPRASLEGDLPPAALIDPTVEESTDANDPNRRLRLARSQTLRAAWSLLPSVDADQPVTVYETTLKDPFSGDLPIMLTEEKVAWGFVAAVFAVSIVACGFLLSLGVIPGFVWLPLAMISLVVAWCVTSTQILTLLYPITLALLITATEAAGWGRSLSRLQELDSRQEEQRAPALRRLLFRGGLGTLIIGLIASQQGSVEAQLGMFTAVDKPASNYEILIPVPSEQLAVDFAGLLPDEYPDVIYATPALANRVGEGAAPLPQLDEILFRTSRYDVSELSGGRLAIRCEFTVLDPAEQAERPRMLLPLSNLSTLTDLKAEVNGETVNLTPLPDETGLEIPLPVTQPVENAEVTAVVDQVGENEAAELLVDPAAVEPRYREFRIVINAIARSTTSEKSVSSRLSIPPSVQNWINWSFGSNTPVDLQLGGSADGIPLVNEQTRAGTLELGLLKSLNFKVDTETQPQEASADYQQLQTDVLCDVGLRHVELKMNLYVKFAEAGRRTMDWAIPEGMYVRGIHAPDVTDSRMSDSADGKTRLHLKFTDVPAGETSTVLLSLMRPIDPSEESITVPLPQHIARKPVDLVWQIALQAKEGGQLTAVEFPEAASTRISQQTFVTNWPDMETILADVQCFRVKSPTRLKVLWDKTISEYSVNATHQLELREGYPATLKSRYRGTSRGRPFWLIDWLQADGWTLTDVKATVDGREVPTRSISAPQQQLAFSDDVTSTFEITAVWDSVDADVSAPFQFNPPRISGAAPYRESITQQIDDGRRYVLRIDEEGTRQVEVSTSPTIAGELSLQGNNAFDLPPVILERQMGPTRPSIPVVEQPADLISPVLPPVRQFSEEPDSATQNDTPEMRSETESLVQADHTLWLEEDVIHGESLFLCDLRQLARQPELTIEIPGGWNDVTVRSSAGLRTTSTGETIQVQLARPLDSLRFQSQYVLLNWTRPVPFSWTGNLRVELPMIGGANPVRCRSLRFDQRNTNPSEALLSWQQYLRTLGRLGRTVDTQSTPAVVASPFTLEDEALQSWPAEYREHYRMLPETLQRRIYRGSLRLRMKAQTRSAPEYFTHVFQADTISTDNQAVVLPQPGWQPQLWLVLIGAPWMLLVGSRQEAGTNTRVHTIASRLAYLMLAGLMIWRLLA